MNPYDPLRDNFPKPPIPAEVIESFCRHAMRGDTDSMAEMHKTHGDDILNKRDNINACAMTWAAYGGHDDVVTYLLAAGVPVDAPGTDDRAALSWAAEMNNPATLALLLAAGADIHAKDKDGKTARDWAIERNRKDIVKQLDDWQEKQQRAAEAKRQHEARTRAAEHRDILRKKSGGFNFKIGK